MSQDEHVQALTEALAAYRREHPDAECEVYRYNPGSVRVRVINPAFAGMSRTRRHRVVWDYLRQKAGEDAMAEVSLLLLLAPDELRDSLANLEFEDRSRSQL